MPKRVKPLSDGQIRNAKPRTTDYCLFDGSGLFLGIKPAGSKLWRFKFTSPTGKAGLLSLGKYPEISLEQARSKAVELRRLIANGDDPSEQRKIEKSLAIAQSQTFEMLARRWIENQSTGWKPVHRYDVTRKLELNVFPAIGSKPVAQVTVGDIEGVLKPLTVRGVHETAHRVLSSVKAILDLAVVEETIPFNPAAHPKIRACLQKKPPVKHFAAITTISELSRLLVAIENYPGGYIVKAAMQLLVLTFVRSTELREARWKEFDLKGKQWTIPGGRTKNKHDHCVPLSKQALTILRQLQTPTRSEPDDLVFASHRPGRSLSANTIGMALRTMGFGNKEMTTHGFRGTASTLLNSSGEWSKDAIERQLGHIEVNKVRSAYCHTDFLEERRRMMQWWSNFLDGLKKETEHG